MPSARAHTDYDALADSYDEDGAQFAIPPDDIVLGLLDDRSSGRVLDIGCGTGRWLAAQRDHYRGEAFDWLGTDPSPGMLRVAASKGLHALAIAGAEHLPLHSSCVDYAISNYCFHHFTDKERAIDEVFRVLAPDGVYRIENMEPAAASGWWLYDFFPETVAVDAARFWPTDRIATALSARHCDVDIDLDRGEAQIPARDALEEAERRVVSQLANIEDDAYEAGLKRLRGGRGSDGPCGDATLPPAGDGSSALMVL